MQSREEKAAELYLKKVKVKRRLLLLKACLVVVRIALCLLPLLDKCWAKIVALLE